jgi:soluble lytic murein transglycosylase
MKPWHVMAAAGGLWLAAGCGGADASGREASAGEVDLAATASASPSSDPLARQADSLVRAGRPWRASALLAPRLVTPDAASPELRLAGARAAAAWNGWTEVERLLRGADWLDRTGGGEGREQLARSDLERGEDAALDARLALDAASDDASRVRRRVLLARAFDRANASDSAAAAYVAAAQRLPRIADWLRLRAAGVLGDSAARATQFSHVGSAVARSRIVPTDAQARERTGDFAGASRAYERSGMTSAAFRASSLAARDDASHRALAQRIVGWLAGSPAADEVRQSIEVLDKLGATLGRDQELVVGRAAAENAPAARAIASFMRARTGGALTPRDEYLYAGALLRAGRGADAAREFATLAGDPAWAGKAAYQRARALLTANDGACARGALRTAATTYAQQAAVAAPTLLLLADLQVDDGEFAGAAATLAQLVSRYPSASQAPLARFRAGLLAWNSSPQAAAAQFDSLLQRYPTDEEAPAARYWAARALDRTGNRADAERRWREVIAASPLSYYAALSAARLHTRGWVAPAGKDSAAHLAAVDSAVARITILQQLGMDVESRFEMDALAARAERNPAESAAIADGLLRVDEPARALRVATRAAQRDPASRPLALAAFPIVNRAALADEARREGLDPALVAGLIRQESSWNPRAVSAVGARGLMQLMPDVGAAVARVRHYPIWNSALLFEPDVSIELGMAHLATSLPQGAPVARALAAYNAGASRVTRWARRPGADDPELFTEWIPFSETRDYVRIVQRNAVAYRALYGMK